MAVVAEATTGTDDAVHFAKRLASVPLEHGRGGLAKRLQALRDSPSPPQRDRDRKAQRGVVQEHERAALLPDRASRSGLEKEIRAGVGPRNERPRDDPEYARTGEPRENPLGYGSQPAVHVRRMSVRRPQPSQRDRDKSSNRCLGGQGAGRREGVEAVVRELVGRNVVADAASLCRLFQ